MTDLTVKINKDINASIEKVFDAWLDPAMLTKFVLPMPGMLQPETTNDPRVGGKFEIIMAVGENKVPHHGEYLEIERPNKLSFTWVSPFSRDDSVVTLIFKSINNEKTNVELTHVKFIDEEKRTNHEGGWSNILNKMTEIFA